MKEVLYSRPTINDSQNIILGILYIRRYTKVLVDEDNIPPTLNLKCGEDGVKYCNLCGEEIDLEPDNIDKLNETFEFKYSGDIIQSTLCIKPI